MWWSLGEKRNNVCGIDDWISANFKLRDSNIFDFLNDNRFQPGFKAIIHKIRGSRNMVSPTGSAGIYVFGAISQSASCAGSGLHDGCSRWMSSEPVINPYAYYGFSENGNVAQSKCDDEQAALSINFYDGESLPFDNDRFDATTITSSILQICDYSTILREAYRILRHGGGLRLYLGSPENCDNYENRFY